MYILIYLYIHINMPSNCSFIFPDTKASKPQPQKPQPCKPQPQTPIPYAVNHVAAPRSQFPPP